MNDRYANIEHILHTTKICSIPKEFINFITVQWEDGETRLFTYDEFSQWIKTYDSDLPIKTSALLASAIAIQTIPDITNGILTRLGVMSYLYFKEQI